jgi:hypothetical protein
MNITSTAPVRQPGSRQALVSFAAALYAVAAIPLSNAAQYLALAAWPQPNGCPPGVDHCVPTQPPVSRLLMGVSSGAVLLLVPAILTATIGGHVALWRLRRQPPPLRGRAFARWGVTLGYAVPLLIVMYVVWILLNGQCCGE